MCEQQSPESACAKAQSDQSLCWSLKLLTEHHLKFLSLTGGCTGSSESTLVKMPHCWKSDVTAHMRSRYNATPVCSHCINKVNKCSCCPYRICSEDFKSYYLYLAYCFKTLDGSLVITENQDEMPHGWSFYQGLHCLVCCNVNATLGLRLFCSQDVQVGSESPCPAELPTYIVYFFNIILCGDFSKINFI